MRQTIIFTDLLLMSDSKTPLQVIYSWLKNQFEDNKKFYVEARIFHHNRGLYEFVAIQNHPDDKLTREEKEDLYTKGWEVLIDGTWRSIELDKPDYLVEKNRFGRPYPRSVFI